MFTIHYRYIGLIWKNVFQKKVTLSKLNIELWKNLIFIKCFMFDNKTWKCNMILVIYFIYFTNHTKQILVWYNTTQVIQFYYTPFTILLVISKTYTMPDRNVWYILLIYIHCYFFVRKWCICLRSRIESKFAIYQTNQL